MFSSIVGSHQMSLDAGPDGIRGSRIRLRQDFMSILTIPSHHHPGLPAMEIRLRTATRTLSRLTASNGCNAQSRGAWRRRMRIELDHVPGTTLTRQRRHRDLN
jgi:hypothetical protein